MTQNYAVYRRSDGANIHWVEFAILAAIICLIGLGTYMVQKAADPSSHALKLLPGEVMLGAPATPLNLETPDGRLSPDYMSIRFSQELIARDFYDEAVSLGEAVCLSKLPGDGKPEFWLRSC